MAERGFLGEFEQMVLLAVVRSGRNAYGLDVRRELERRTGREVSRGGFYTTLDRLEKKGYLTWEESVPPDPGRKARQRRFSVTPDGMEELRRSRTALLSLWDGLEGQLGG